jgi:D-xylose transport system ATP-binding protein
MTEISVLLGLIKKFKEKGMACVYISHKLAEVAEVADTVTVIRDGTHVCTAPMADLSIDAIITMMVGREIRNLFPREDHPIGEVIFEVRNVTCWDPTNPARRVVKDVSFQLRRGEILGIAGLVGAGRTELVSKIFGCYRGQQAGDVYLQGRKLSIAEPSDAIRHGISMVPEDRKRQGIVPLLGVGHNITLPVMNGFVRNSLIDDEAEMVTIRRQIERMQIKPAQPLLPIIGLSGGNQQKAVVGKMLMPLPQVLILDEPTRGVDVGSKYEIYKLMFELAKNGVSIIMVSSELEEILGISDRVLVLGEGELRGDFDNHGLTQERILAAALGQMSSTLN